MLLGCQSLTRVVSPLKQFAVERRQSTYLEDEEEGHPLVVLDLPGEGVLSVGALMGEPLTVLEEEGRADPGKRNVDPGDAQHRACHEVRAVDPAIGVERLRRYVPGGRSFSIYDNCQP